MPRPKLKWKSPGERENEEIEEYRRFQRVEKLQTGMRESLPPADAFGNPARLLPMLHEFQERIEGAPRVTKTMTLNFKTMQILAWLEHELKMHPGKCVDWLAHGFRKKYLEDQKRQKEEYRAKAIARGEDPDEDLDKFDFNASDDDDDEDENENENEKEDSHGRHVRRRKTQDRKHAARRGRDDD